MNDKLSIGILGSRGIPNEYGGYEAAVEELAPRLVKLGHDVIVYCSASQKSRYKNYNGVKLVYNFDPEKWIGSAGQFIYDLLSNLSAKKKKHDVIFHMGYTSDSIWHKLWDKNASHLTNMDGLEWKRTKYSRKARKFLAYAEKLAATKSNCLIADNKGIEKYLDDKYNTDIVTISYGVSIPVSFSEGGLSKYKLTKEAYDLVIARMVPENNIETIIKAKLMSDDTTPLVIFGNETNYKIWLQEQYKNQTRIKFFKGDFNKKIMDGLRHFSRYYIHGHSVGGTNPSLLESMAAASRIIAHDNEFNRNVLYEGGRYFKDIKQLLNYFNSHNIIISKEQVDRNRIILQKNHNWNEISYQYEQAALKYKA